MKFAEIEAELNVVLPNEYCQFMAARADEFEAENLFRDDFTTFFVEPARLIEANIMERAKNSGTSHAFPDWERTYLLVGTNGGGDFYCLHLDNRPGVWLIGSDCGDVPTQVAPSLEGFVNLEVKLLRAQRERDAKRQTRIQGGMPDIERAPIGADRAKATEWLAGQSKYLMFNLLDNAGRKLSPRKLRLFGIACCRRRWEDMTIPECRQAILLAERMTLGQASAEEVVELRHRLKTWFLSNLGVRDQTNQWNVGVTKNLLQDDDAYLTDAPILAGDADLRAVVDSLLSSAPDYCAENDAQMDLLRDIVGNPFLPMRFESNWRTSMATGLARTMFETQDFTQMPALADALEAGGCDESSILHHCRLPGSHVRGCWVVDLVLGLEIPNPPEMPFAWDFSLERPSINSASLKKRIQKFGTDPTSEPTAIDAHDALTFADWLEMHGDSAWARYIRVRCELDGKAPAADYADLLEALAEAAAGMEKISARFEGFFFSGYRFTNPEWWHEDNDDLEQGLPSFVHAVTPGRGAGPVSRLVQRLESLVRSTPVRGIDFDSHYTQEIAEILASPGGRLLRRIRFCNRPNPGQVGPVIEALASAPTAKSLERLDIQDGLLSDSDVLALANVPFERLGRLDLHSFDPIDCSTGAVTRLMTTPWFRRLRQTLTGFSDACCEAGMIHLAEMQELHSLALWRTHDQQILALKRAGEFPALKRLFVQGVNLAGEVGEAFCQWKAPELLELWLEYPRGTADGLSALAQSPLFRKLQVLTVSGPMLNETVVNAIAASACSPQLRILRLGGIYDGPRTFHSLAETALTTPNAFPNLTTLFLNAPFREDAIRDTAEFFRRLATPKLRHLTMKECEFDDECATAVASRFTFANLTRLEIVGGALSPQAAEMLIRSPNLSQIIELRIDGVALGRAIELFLNESVMPNLAYGWFNNCETPLDLIDRLHAKRPVVHVYRT